MKIKGRRVKENQSKRFKIGALLLSWKVKNGTLSSDSYPYGRPILAPSVAVTLGNLRRLKQNSPKHYDDFKRMG